MNYVCFVHLLRTEQNLKGGFLFSLKNNLLTSMTVWEWNGLP